MIMASLSRRSYSPEQLITRARQAAAEGVKEIWLTGEDVGAYGVDLPPIVPQADGAATPASHPVSSVDGVATAPDEPITPSATCHCTSDGAGSSCGDRCGCRQKDTHWTLPKLVREIAAVLPEV